MKALKRIVLFICIVMLCAGCAGETRDTKESQSASSDKVNEQEQIQIEKEKTEQERLRKEAEETQRLKEEALKREEEARNNALQPQQPASLPSNGKTIVIDPGHSSVVPEGSEPVGPGAQEYKAADTTGTTGCVTGMPEYELTLTVSQKLKTELEKRGYRVLLTRQDSTAPLGCTQRAAVANGEKAYAFIRIHANGSEDSSVQGAMTICTTPANVYAPQLYAQSRQLSDCIINRLSEATGCQNDGVWETDTMSGNNWSQVPVTIVEMGYMTNPQEDQLMAQGEYQDKIVQGIANGVDDFR